jgi:hypothetical protein
VKSIQFVMAVLLVMAATTVSGEISTETPSVEPSSKAWWNNQGKIQVLSLSVQQRMNMEKHLIFYLTQNRKMIKEQEIAMGMLDNALAEANALAATAAGDEAAEIARDAIGRQVSMTSNVVSILEDEQLATLLENYPGLLAQFWKKTSSQHLLKPALGGGSPREMQQRPVSIDTASVMQSSSGLYTVSYRPSDSKAIPLSSIHTWELQVTTAGDMPVEDARVRFGATMPEHGHGMNTRPEIRPSEKRGTYLVEGINFHMPGWWVVSVGITGNQGPELVRFNVVVGEDMPLQNSQTQE